MAADATPLPVSYFFQAHHLMRVPMGARGRAWRATARDVRVAMLKIMSGPEDADLMPLLHDPGVPKLVRDDAAWRAAVWAATRLEVEAWSARLEADFLRFSLEQPYPLTGTA